MKIRGAYVAAAVAFLVTLIVSHLRSTPYNNYTLLADALLHGRTWIDWPGPVSDALLYRGEHYVIEAPWPALLMLPLVAIWGTAANQTLVAVILCGVAIGAAWELCRRYGLSTPPTVWLCAFLLAGTDLLWCAMLGDVWFIAHVSAACFTLLALVELAGKRRGWLVALWAACAFESRFSLVLALPVYAYLLATDEGAPLRVSPRWRTCAIGFVAVLVPVAALWTLYNFGRWGTWYDIGYTAWYHQDPVGMSTGSPFRLQYLTYQLWSFFVQGAQRLPQAPWFAPTVSGLALTWTSPALVLVFLANRPARLTIALWVLTVLNAAPDFLYYVNGGAQFGMRHALDFEPFLFALMALGTRKRMPVWGGVLIAYSVLVGLWGCWFWNAYLRPTY